MSSLSWRRLARRTVYQSKHLTLHLDRVQLPTGQILADYSVVERPAAILIVATDRHDNIITISEYTYAANQVIRALPTGYVEPNEDPVMTAQRELLEETGYGGGEFALVQRLEGYPSKDVQVISVIRARNVELIKSPHPEASEQIEVRLLSPQQLQTEITQGKWLMATPLAALVVTGLAKLKFAPSAA